MPAPKWKHPSTNPLYKSVYQVWADMRKRCLNPSFPQWKDYGGRGITICDKWINDFDAFYDDMGSPIKGLTIERIDNNGNYEPGNCRWANHYEQHRNRRNNRKTTYDGQEYTVSELSRKFGIGWGVLNSRLLKGLTAEQAINLPLQRYDIEWRGETHSLSSLERISGIPRQTLRKRFAAGYSVEEALTIPVKHRKSPRRSAEIK